MRKGQHQESQGFPDGSVVKSMPANAGDTGSIPDPGRPHVLGATKPICHNYSLRCRAGSHNS